MKIVHGDLIALALNGDFDVIIHGCNCFQTMGAGIAKSIKAEFPEAFQSDKQTAYGERDKLGTISTATVMREGHEITVVNAYTQFDWRGGGRKVDYNAIGSCFKHVACQFEKSRIGYPYIGAGLAGGDWAQIEPIINTALKGIDHTLVIFQP